MRVIVLAPDLAAASRLAKEVRRDGVKVAAADLITPSTAVFTLAGWGPNTQVHHTTGLPPALLTRLGAMAAAGCDVISHDLT